MSAYYGAHANGRRCSHLSAAANKQYYDRNVSNEGEQQRRDRHPEYYHQYLDRDQPAEDVPESTQLRLPDETTKLLDFSGFLQKLIVKLC
jgi:hypothetical protein